MRLGVDSSSMEPAQRARLLRVVEWQRLDREVSQGVGRAWWYCEWLGDGQSGKPVWSLAALGAPSLIRGRRKHPRQSGNSRRAGQEEAMTGAPCACTMVSMRSQTNTEHTVQEARARARQPVRWCAPGRSSSSSTRDFCEPRRPASTVTINNKYRRFGGRLLLMSGHSAAAGSQGEALALCWLVSPTRHYRRRCYDHRQFPCWRLSMYITCGIQLSGQMHIYISQQRSRKQKCRQPRDRSRRSATRQI